MGARAGQRLRQVLDGAAVDESRARVGMLAGGGTARGGLGGRLCTTWRGLCRRFGRGAGLFGAAGADAPPALVVVFAVLACTEAELGFEGLP